MEAIQEKFTQKYIFKYLYTVSKNDIREHSEEQELTFSKQNQKLLN